MSGNEDLEAFAQIAYAVTGRPADLRLHDGTWCRNCDDGCGEEYGGVCACCSAWSREDGDDA